MTSINPNSLTWYHYSNKSDITSLNVSGDGYLGSGVYLTTNPTEPQHGKYRYTCDITISNHITFNDNELNESIDFINNEIKNSGVDPKYILPFDNYNNKILYKLFGYDSIVRILTDGDIHIAVFDENNVKIINMVDMYNHNDMKSFIESLYRGDNNTLHKTILDGYNTIFNSN